jgi:ribosome recycling factor
VFAPKGKKGGKGGGDSEETAAPVVLPDLKRLDAGMEDKISRMTEEFSKIRGGRVSPDMFKSLIVDVHGAKIPLAEAGQVTLATPTKLSVTTYDASAATPGRHTGHNMNIYALRKRIYCILTNINALTVANALRVCGMGLNPTVEGGTVLATIPKPSAETRENFVKVAGKAAEKVCPT